MLNAVVEVQLNINNMCSVGEENHTQLIKFSQYKETSIHSINLFNQIVTVSV